jgi:hypothetical protein
MEATIPRSMLRAKRQSSRCAFSRKVGFRSRRKARQFAERSTQYTHRPFRAYQCACGAWHLTSQPRMEEAA